VKEYPDRREWELAGHEVTRLLIDYRFTIEVWWYHERCDHTLRLTIGAPFWDFRSGNETWVNPEDPNTVAPALAVLHKPTQTLRAFRGGRLILTLSDGTEIVVEKDPHYEAWEASGTGDLSDVLLLCSPHEGPPWREGAV
jgi:hypothetical protein